MGLADGDANIFMISTAPFWVRVPLFLELLTMFNIAEAAWLERLESGLVLRLMLGEGKADSKGEWLTMLIGGDTSSFQDILGGV